MAGMLIGGAGFAGGYFLNMPYSSYVVGVGLLIGFIGIFMKSKQSFA